MKRPQSVVLCNNTFIEGGHLVIAVFRSRQSFSFIHKIYSKLRKKILTYIKIFKSHYKHFTPELRFIYCVKRLFAYCFDKAPTLYLGFYINTLLIGANIIIQHIFGLSQALKTRTLVQFCYADKKIGGVVC